MQLAGEPLRDRSTDIFPADIPEGFQRVLRSLMSLPELLDSGALRFVVLERGHVVGDPTGHHPIFKPSALGDRLQHESNIWVSDSVVTTQFPGSAAPVIGAENPVMLEWDGESQALCVRLKPTGPDSPVVVTAQGKLTLYCDPGSDGHTALEALRTLALLRWMPGDRSRRPLHVNLGWPDESGSVNGSGLDSSVLSGITPPFNERFLTVSTAVDSAPMNATPLTGVLVGHVQVGPQIAARLVKALQGRLFVNHTLGWNFIRLVERPNEGTRPRHEYPFSMETSLGQSRPVGTPLLLKCVHRGRGEALVDSRLFPQVDPARAVIPLMNEQIPHRFAVAPAARTTPGIDSLADWSLEYLVRQDWGDITPRNEEVSAPPRGGQNVRFRVRALSSPRTRLSWTSWLDLSGSGATPLDSRAQLAAACNADAPKELAESMRPVKPEDIRIELRPSLDGPWLPSAIVRCEVSAGPRLMDELGYFVGPLQERLTQRATLGTQVVVELTARQQP